LITKDKKTKCPICLDEIVEDIKPYPGCGHPFHEDCIDSWTKLKDTCPICRKGEEKIDEISNMMYIFDNMSPLDQLMIVDFLMYHYLFYS
jgi:hypothetical protein